MTKQEQYEALAKMLPEYKDEDAEVGVRLAACWVVEEGLTGADKNQYFAILETIVALDYEKTGQILKGTSLNVSRVLHWLILHASPEQRITALAKVKGIK